VTIDYELDGHVAVITINRPEARNAVNRDVAEGMEAAIDRLEEDDEAWIGIITGARTEKGWVFSAGADLKAMTTDAGGMMTKKGGFAGLVQRERTKPIIAAVDGPALAGGTEIVLACDLVVASRTAVFGIPEVKRNLVAGAGGLFRLGRKLPRNVAMELALTGRLDFPAERAHHFGLVNELCDEGGALDAAKALASRITENAPLAVRESRRIIIEAADQPEEVGWKLSGDGMAKLFGTEDFGEGLTAFAEKRAPVWKGR
jgi:enoyl-CoA hydratase